jgi:hypothetical protein
MNSRRRISALQRFVGKPIAIRDALEPVLMAAGYRSGRRCLLDHLSGAKQNRLGYLKAKRFGGLEVDDQINFRGLLYWQVRRTATLTTADLTTGNSRRRTTDACRGRRATPQPQVRKLISGSLMPVADAWEMVVGGATGGGPPKRVLGPRFS